MAAAKKKPAAKATTQAKPTAEKPDATAQGNSTADKSDQSTQAASTGDTATGATETTGQQGTQEPQSKAPETKSPKPKAPATKPAEPKATTQEQPTREVLRVRSLAAGFRRAGFGFSPKERVLFLDDLSEDQVRALEAERNLSVKRDVVPAEPDTDTGE